MIWLLKMGNSKTYKIVKEEIDRYIEKYADTELSSFFHSLKKISLRSGMQYPWT